MIAHPGHSPPFGPPGPPRLVFRVFLLFCTQAIHVIVSCLPRLTFVSTCPLSGIMVGRGYRQTSVFPDRVPNTCADPDEYLARLAILSPSGGLIVGTDSSWQGVCAPLSLPPCLSSTFSVSPLPHLLLPLSPRLRVPLPGPLTLTSGTCARGCLSPSPSSLSNARTCVCVCGPLCTRRQQQRPCRHGQHVQRRDVRCSLGAARVGQWWVRAPS